MKHKSTMRGSNRSAGFESLESRQLLSAAAPRRVIGYLPEYRFGALSQVDFSALTHLNYFSIGATSAGALTTGGISLSHLAQARDAAHAAGDTISITVGPQSFSTLAGSSTALNTFVTNVIAFVQNNHLDGIDLDWEPPESSSLEKTRYGTLIDTLYTAAHPLGLLLSAAVNPITKEIPVAQANKLDWVNVMAYDFDYANHSTSDAATAAMTSWNNYGVAADKLVMGVPFYGRSGTSWSNSTATTYGDVVSSYYKAHGTYPSPSTDEINGVFFNGPTTIAAKAQFVLDNNFGGVMVWELGQDHFTAQGGYDAASLLPVIKGVIQPVHDALPPTVTASAFGFQTARTISMTFSEDVGASVARTGLQVTRVEDGSNVTPTALSYNTATNTATFTLPSLADGHYHATLAAAGVHDAAGNHLTSDATLDFSWLAGDVDRDGMVGFSDLVILAQNYGATGRTFSQGNLDLGADGVVDFNDLVILAQRYGSTLTPLAPAATPARQKRVAFRGDF